MFRYILSLLYHIVKGIQGPGTADRAIPGPFGIHFSRSAVPGIGAMLLCRIPWICATAMP